MSENKTGKYFKYAIGEIVLVVIGILIALQINNWNENRKDKAQEQLLLIQLMEEYESNLKQLDEKITLRNEVVKYSQKLLKHIDNKIVLSRDSIIKCISQSSSAPTFDPVTNQLIISGNLTMLEDERLKKALSNWTTDVVQVKEEEHDWNDFKDLVRTPFLIKHNVHRDLLAKAWMSNQLKETFIDKTFEMHLDIGVSKRHINYDSIVKIPEFESMLAYGISRNAAGNAQSYILREQIDYILSLINENLD